MNTLTIAHSDYGVNPIPVIDLGYNHIKSGEQQTKKSGNFRSFTGDATGFELVAAKMLKNAISQILIKILEQPQAFLTGA